MDAPASLIDHLARAGFLDASGEAAELVARAAGDEALLAALLARRLTGEPLAWITGHTTFCGRELRIDPGVYVPRRQSELLARRAVARLPDAGVAVELCCGAGPLAVTLAANRPAARVLGTDCDERAIACARSNGVEAYLGDLLGPLPQGLAGTVDVIAGVVPYVPTESLGLLQRDTFTFESALAYDGGPGGITVLRRVVATGPAFLRVGGTLLLELGAGQAEALEGELARHGFRLLDALRDEEGDVRGIEAVKTHDP